MKEILKQLVTIWRELKPLQKGAFCAILLFVIAAMSFLLLKSSSSAYVPIYSGKTLTKTEIQEVRTYLEHFAIHFEEDKEKGITVMSEHVDQIRMELAAAGIPKQNQGKGFELFDTNTWIKGEKELQVLEMRALKGQLEKDLAGFEHIKSASVILDIPPQRSFNSGVQYQTKASVILTLMHGARLSTSELRAITNHLAGAVRGLESNMIAISDTSGKLYKAIDPRAEEEPFIYKQALFEERVEEKIAALLTRLVGDEHFYATVQAVLDKETEEVLSLSISTVIDRYAVSELGETQSFQTEIQRQLGAVASGYGLTIEPVVDIIPFEKKRKIWIEHKQSGNYTGLIFTLFFVVVVVIASFPLFRRYKKNKGDDEEALFRMMTRIDVDKLADSIHNEDPATIALMLSYLEPKRAEQMIVALSSELQEEVLFHLSELEKEEI